MTPAEVAAKLQYFNDWRRGDYEPSEQPEPPNPYEVGLAIDAAIEMFERLEEAESDALEQARLNGMGSEREAALMAKLEAAEKERDDVAQQLVQSEIGKRNISEERDALRAKVEQMERQEPVAWKYEIAAYADHRTDVGVVLNKRELSSAVPAEQITWTPLFAFDGRQTPEASRTAIEMIDRLEAAEEEIESWKGLAKQFGNEDDAPRAKVEQMERQEPVAKVRVHQTGGNAGIAWSVAPLNDFDALPLMRDGDRLYALPGAKGEAK